ncbi:hypothetical protein FRC02_006248 [Tulasnella sp. 418]|nr:hypothetical protein FRC02_006248 [Tulasnella sp. 418]
MDSTRRNTYAESEKTAIGADTAENDRVGTPVADDVIDDLEKRASIDRQVKDDPDDVLPGSSKDPEVNPDVEIVFPEGGRGWWIVVGCWFMTSSTFGLVNSWVSTLLLHLFIAYSSD